jgi:hypothetical protein
MPYEPDFDFENGSDYANGDNVFVDNADITEPAISENENTDSYNPDSLSYEILYAPEIPQLRSVTYLDTLASGGSPPTAQTTIRGNEVVLRENTGSLIRTGFLFDGWSTAAGGGTVFMPGDAVTLEDSLVLHPVWINNTFTVFYRANGATGGTVPLMHFFVPGEPVRISANSGNLVREGYTFFGWQLAGSNRIFRESEFSTLPGEHVEFLAYWIPAAATVLLDDDDYTDAEVDAPLESAALDNVVDAWITAGMDFFRGITDRFDSTRAFVEENYAHNRTFDFDGFIFDQRAADARNLRFGSGAMWRNDAQFNPDEGWGWYNGCGWVATYNAALLLDKEYHPAYIIRYFELLGGAVADGMFGLNPMAIDTFFQNRGVTTNTHNLPAATDDIIRGSSVSVLTYIRSDGGAHIVTIYYDSATEMFRVFNDWTAGSTRTSPGELRSVDEWLQSDNNNIWQTLTVTTLW